MEIKEHKMIGDNISFVETPKVYAEYANGQPDTIVIHYTAGDSTEGAVKVLTKPKDQQPQASAHMVVGMDGQVVQLAPLNRITAHAGTSEYNLPTGKRTSFNKYSIGIEISNPGYLTKTEDKFYTWYKKEVPAEAVFEGAHRNAVTKAKYWYKYPQVQIDKVFEICEAIMKAYPIKYILGHEEIAPGRKTDPGPAFPLDLLREKLGAWKPLTVPETGLIGWVAKDYIEFDNSDENDFDAIVAVNVLNIRATPGGDKLAQPLKKDAKLKVFQQQDGWVEVQVLS